MQEKYFWLFQFMSYTIIFMQSSFSIEVAFFLFAGLLFFSDTLLNTCVECVSGLAEVLFDFKVYSDDETNNSNNNNNNNNNNFNNNNNNNTNYPL